MHTRIVEENITNAVSLKQMAYRPAKPVELQRRDFLFIYNMPPSKYIRLKRLDKARELLLGTNMAVSSICYTLGFESIAFFTPFPNHGLVVRLQGFVGSILNGKGYLPVIEMAFLPSSFLFVCPAARR